ncbi:MAG TPA: endonuclease/exonuclease/phosphatase family protein [Bacteroidota bacterium]|nr:endonuclease/exonuclease/phosphatase family protein [Bacteroidota bacterium]
MKVMMKESTAITMLSVLLLAVSLRAGEKSLRVVTFNVWSGLDYSGSLRMGEYETQAEREERFRLLVSQVRSLDPDILLLQEVNPAGGFARRLADSLGYDEIHQVCIAGLKIGPLGIPSNLNEGNAILARPSLRLKLQTVWKLSGPPGVVGDVFSFHFSENIFALVGKITVGGLPLYIVNVHLSAGPPENALLRSAFDSLSKASSMGSEQYAEAIGAWHERSERQGEELARLSKDLRSLPPEIPVIVAGDFNAAEGISTHRLFPTGRVYFDVSATTGDTAHPTWDPVRNPNIRYSTNLVDARGDSLMAFDQLSALFDQTPRRIDRIFLCDRFSSEDVIRYSTVFDSAPQGQFLSDHFGVMADLSLDRVEAGAPMESETLPMGSESTLEPFPIVSFDTDVGLGYGAKCFVLNKLGGEESFDCTFFNSTKGERWYRFVFSIPDFELRQGKRYPIAFDLAIDYDKWIKNSFFGIGNRSGYDRREYYSREPLDISATVSKAYSPVEVVQAGVRYNTVRNFNFTDSSALAMLLPAANAGTTSFESFFANFRYDTRNSFINPSSGVVAQGQVEQTVHTSFSSSRFSILSFTLQYYTVLFYPTTVLAVRLMGQDVIGNNLPVQVLSSVGGNLTLRGYPQDRFLDNLGGVANAELRFPVIWRFGGVLGYDAGKVWRSASKVDLGRWAVNPVAGVRFYMETFVVRCDVGFGHEATGLYFNFGQLF